MNCEQARPLLQRLVDEELDDRQTLRLEAHLGDCTSCHDELEKLGALIRAARTLPAGIEPERDLWPEIASRLSPQPSAGLREWLVPLAAAAGLIGSLALAAILALRGETPISTESAVEAETAGRQELTLSADLARFEDGAMMPRIDLLSALEQQRDRLDPKLLEDLEADVRGLNLAIGEIRLALEERPQNARLNLLLAAKYQQEVEILHRLRRL